MPAKGTIPAESASLLAQRYVLLTQSLIQSVLSGRHDELKQMFDARDQVLNHLEQHTMDANSQQSINYALDLENHLQSLLGEQAHQVRSELVVRMKDRRSLNQYARCQPMTGVNQDEVA